MVISLVTQCAYVPIPEATDLAMSYYRLDNFLWIVQWLCAFIFPLFFLVTGLSAKIAGLTKKWFWGIVLYVFIFVAIYQIASLPLAYYADYLVEHKYGLSNQTIDRWLANYAIGSLIVIFGAVSVIWIFYWFLQKSPRRWWIYSSIALISLEFVVAFIQPIWIDPLFNTFKPMQNKKLEAKVLDLAARAGIQGGRVFEVDKSQDTKKENAYVTGLGSTKRIVFWDTIIKGESEEGLLFITGHEMGHYVLHHIWWMILFSFALSTLLFYAVYKSSHFLLARYHKIFGFKTLHSVASLPLLFLLISFYSFLSLPLTNWFSRYQEHQADIFGLEMTHSNRAAGQAFTKLAKENLANPRPGLIYKIWRASHPPIAERIEFTNTYCPWNMKKEGSSNE